LLVVNRGMFRRRRPGGDEHEVRRILVCEEAFHTITILARKEKPLDVSFPLPSTMNYV